MCDAYMFKIAALTKLQALDLCLNVIGDAGIIALTTLRSLCELKVGCHSCHRDIAESLMYFKTIASLQKLTFGNDAFVVLKSEIAHSA
jgi:hypothetical protein